MNLSQLGQMLAAHGLKSETYFASRQNLDDFRRVAVQNLARDQDFILVNYQRAAIDQKQSGHISPIAAYHQASDRFLILDVATYKYPPVWVKAEALWAAMNSLDGEETRGYVVVSRK